MKTCCTCKNKKSVSEFYKLRSSKDGLFSCCKECKLKATVNWQRRNKDKVAKWAKRWAEKNPQKKRDSWNNWYRENGGREKRTEYNKERIHKLRANWAVKQAIRKGSLKRPKVCQCCKKKSDRIESHHHKGYEKEFWLDVMWVCTKCHKKLEVQLEYNLLVGTS